MVREDGSILFDPTKCDDCFHMVRGWDEENHYNKIVEPYMNNYKNRETQIPKYRGGWVWEINERLVYDPDKERTLKWRKGKGSGNFHKRDHKKDRQKIQRKFKTKMRKNIEKEEYYRPVPHDYRSYGWETW